MVGYKLRCSPRLEKEKENRLVCNGPAIDAIQMIKGVGAGYFVWICNDWVLTEPILNQVVDYLKSLFPILGWIGRYSQPFSSNNPG